MIIYANVKPGSKSQKIERISENRYNIWLREKAIDGKANTALMKLISKEFNVNYRSIKIKGLASRKKTIEITSSME